MPTRARAAVWAGLGFGFPTWSGSFWTGSHRYRVQRITPAPLSGSEPKQRNGWQETAANGWAVSVWNELLQRFRLNRCNRSDGNGRVCPFQSAINCAPFLSFKHTQIETEKQRRTIPFFCNSDSEVKFCDSDSEVTSNRKWKFCNSDSEVTSQILKIRSEKRLRKFNRFFNRIVVWFCDFQRWIFFYLPPFSAVGVPPK